MIETIERFMNSLPAMDRRKDPNVAAFLGVVLGGLALGIYFKSFIDFLVPIAIAVAFTVVAGDIGWIGGALCAAFWGYMRADESNKRLAAQAAAAPAN